MRFRPLDTHGSSTAGEVTRSEKPSYVGVINLPLAEEPNVELADSSAPPELRPHFSHAFESCPASRLDLSAFWHDLTGSRLKVVDAFLTDSASVLVVVPARPNPEARRHLRPQKLRVLERVLLKGGQKSVAAELGLAPSTVAIIAGNCLRAMGMDSGASRAPLAMVIAAHASAELTNIRYGEVRTLVHAGVTYSLVSTSRPEQELARALSPAEFSVARLLVEGRTHAEMSALRKTSTRTIANQLASAFAKLGVSGRAELLCRMIQQRGLQEAAPQPRELVLMPFPKAVGE